MLLPFNKELFFRDGFGQIDSTNGFYLLDENQIEDLSAKIQELVDSGRHIFSVETYEFLNEYPYQIYDKIYVDDNLTNMVMNDIFDALNNYEKVVLVDILKHGDMVIMRIAL